MDSGDLEKEKGITILAKNTSLVWHDQCSDEDITLNIVDTPGHADFGGEVERALTMVDGIVLLVDAAEGPLPQTRFVLRKALARDLPVILVDQQDRPPRCPHRRSRRRGLRAVLRPRRRRRTRSSSRSSTARAATAGRTLDLDEAHAIVAGDGPTDADLTTFVNVLLEHIPAPTYHEGAPLQAWVTNLDASPYLGRLALLRIMEGKIKKGQSVAWCKTSTARSLGPRSPNCSSPNTSPACRSNQRRQGDLVAVAGIEEIYIGETLADPENPIALPIITVDEPALSMTIGINTSPLAGREGKKLTARLVKNRLDQELVGNVSIRVLPDRAPRRLGSASPRRAAAGDPRRADAPRRLRADRRQAGRADQGDRRQSARARRARHHRRARRVPRRRHPTARHPQGPHAEHDRHRLGASRLPRAGAWADRVPHPVHDRNARHRRHQPHLRGLRAVGGRDPCTCSRACSSPTASARSPTTP